MIQRIGGLCVDIICTVCLFVFQKKVENPLNDLSGPKKVANMLESFRAFRRKQFKPNERVRKQYSNLLRVIYTWYCLDTDLENSAILPRCKTEDNSL